MSETLLFGNVITNRNLKRTKEIAEYFADIE